MDDSRAILEVLRVKIERTSQFTLWNEATYYAALRARSVDGISSYSNIEKVAIK